MFCVSLPSVSLCSLLFVLVTTSFSEAARRRPWTRCKFRVVTKPYRQCTGTFLLGSDGIFRKFTPYQHQIDSTGSFVSSVNDETDWFFQVNDELRLFPSSCQDSQGIVVGLVNSECTNDNHVCITDRAYPSNGPAFGSGVDGPESCPMYRTLPWGDSFEGFKPNVEQFVWAENNRSLTWSPQANVFHGCETPGPSSPTNCTTPLKDFSLGDEACTAADQYFPYLTVLDYDTDVADCVGNYRLVQDKLWRHIVLNVNNNAFYESGVQLAWNGLNIDGSLSLTCSAANSTAAFPDVTLAVSPAQGFRTGTYCFDYAPVTSTSTSTTSTTSTSTTSTSTTSTSTSATVSVPVPPPASGSAWQSAQPLTAAVVGAILVAALL